MIIAAWLAMIKLNSDRYKHFSFIERLKFKAVFNGNTDYSKNVLGPFFKKTT